MYHQHPVQLLEPDTVAELPEENLLLVQVTSATLYAQVHVPGAVLVEPSELVCGYAPAPGKLPDQGSLDKLFSRLGLTGEQRVVAFDDEGGGWAGRFLWTLDVIGYYDWGYMNGGLHAWHHAGLPLQSGPGADRQPTQMTVNIDTAPIASQAEVLAAISDPEQLIWDVRSAEEFAGLRSGSMRRGHIPGAVNFDWELLKDVNQQLRLTDNFDELARSLGLLDAQRIITHCQTHHRSGLAYLVGRLLGLDIRAYDGSWAEWGNDPETPIEEKL